MGLAASQARLLSLTSRIHDVEFQAQQIQSAKLQLALLEDKAYQEYNNALDAQTLTFANTKGERIAATFENLCGLGSINNNIGTDAYYTFRDRDDHLIVPSDIYDAYDQMGENDPYKFALKKLGLSLNETDDLGNNIFEDTINALSENSNNKALQNVKNANKAKLDELFKKSADYANYQKELQSDPDSAKAKKEDWQKNFLAAICGTDVEVNDSTLKLFFDSDIFDDIKDDIESFQDSYKDEYQYLLYKTANGAKAVYGAITGNEDNFDSDKFNYYVRWGQLIEMEGGIEYCTYDNSLEKDPELLNDSLMSGYIRIDKVYSNKGKISEEATSASSDSNVTFVNTSSIDSTALKKAEADYNKKLKDIQQIDKKHDMNLNRLETERNALTTEYDSVKKVISENIERTFGIFS